jgi:hypothetical protein
VFLVTSTGLAAWVPPLLLVVAVVRMRAERGARARRS